MAQTIQFKRGNEVNLPPLALGEPAITLDTLKLFYGTPNGNIELAKAHLVSPDGSKWSLTISNEGVISAVKI